MPEIRLRFPRAKILVRAYSENWTQTDPLEWALAIAQWANELRPFGIEITFANEQNLAAEGHPLGARPGKEYPPASVYHDILKWDTVVIQQLRARIPWALIHFPALSQGHSDDQADAGYVGFEILKEAVQMCDVVDAHTYWDDDEPGQRTDVHYGERFRLLHSLFPDKPIFISECGALTSNPNAHGKGVAQWLEALPEYVSGACWFIWDSDTGNQPWVLRDKPVLAEALRSHQLTKAPWSVPDSIVNPIHIAMALVSSWEGFSARARETSGGAQVIGYGHLMQQSETIGHSISEPEATKLLRRDLGACLASLKELAKHRLTMNQEAALLSFVYDIGIDALQGSTLLDSVNEPDIAGAALALRQWRRRDGRNSPDSVRRRQMESELFLRDILTPAAPTSPLPAGPAAPVQCTISATATWVKVKQGERYQVIGVWCYEDAQTKVANTTDGSEELTSGGRVLVRVEDDSGVGIPAELVARRWDNPNGECEPQLSDASGAAWIELGDGSRFDPAQGRGPDRIQVGDSMIAGLGIPSYGTGTVRKMTHVIRIQKVA